MEKTTNKLIAIFISILIVSMTFTISFSLSSQVVKADEQFGCCELTKTQLICQETERGNCQDGFHSGQACSQIGNCKPGTCVPPEGRCMAQKMKEECDAIQGFWSSTPMENIQVCQEGCCGIAKGIKSEVLQRKECTELAIDLGYDPDEDVEFDTSITSQTECFKKYATQDRGCCVLGGGQCEYGIRESCTTLGGNFIPLAGNKYCNAVTHCAVTKHEYYDCGKLPGTEFDIYWFDSQGSQEDIYEECNYPTKICTKYETGEVECKSTKCHIQGTAQEIVFGEENGFPKISSGNTPIVKTIDINELLLTGQSTCYNFFSHYDGQDNNGLYERSTGLQNQILHCRLGDIEIEGLGPDREKLCFLGGKPGEDPPQSSTQHANVIENEWEECTDCGSGGVLFVGGIVGDLLGPFPPLGRSIAGTLGHYCDPKSCNDYGDCVYHEDFPSWWSLGLATRTGSCNPKYPPGTVEQCSQCGRGGDGLWNVCDDSECASLGDCEFKPHSDWMKWGAWFPILSLVSTYMYRINFIPAEFILCTFPGVFFICEPFGLVKDRVDRYLVGPFGPFINMLSFWDNKDTLSKTIGTVFSGALVGVVTQTIMGFFKK